jgi:plasmid stabilization system protein ParE
VTPRVELHPLAEDDVRDAWIWYERQRPGLGDQFLDAFTAAVEHITQWPKSGQPTLTSEDGTIVERRAPTPGFPYAIRYRATDEVLLIVVVYHPHRDPEFGKDRAP